MWIVCSVAAVLSFAFISAAHAWRIERSEVEYTDKQVFSAPVEVNSDLSFGGTKLTATAAELNAAGTAVQAADSTYTATVAKAASALQPGAVGDAATNTTSHALSITIDGTNYLVALYPVND